MNLKYILGKPFWVRACDITYGIRPDLGLLLVSMCGNFVCEANNELKIGV